MVIGKNSLKGNGTRFEATIQRQVSYLPLAPIYVSQKRALYIYLPKIIAKNTFFFK